jgi:hypothetical protein
VKKEASAEASFIREFFPKRERTKLLQVVIPISQELECYNGRKASIF